MPCPHREEGNFEGLTVDEVHTITSALIGDQKEEQDIDETMFFSDLLMLSQRRDVQFSFGRMPEPEPPISEVKEYQQVQAVEYEAVETDAAGVEEPNPVAAVAAEETPEGLASWG